MGLKIELRDNLYCEMFVCDWCDRIIEDHKKSMILWYLEDTERMECYTLCKGKGCIPAFEHAHGRAYSSEMRHSMTHLANNLDLKLADDCDELSHRI